MTHNTLPSPDPRESLDAMQRAAETVRRHLVHLRGGAPFLSAADGALLVSWLEDGVPLHRILRGLEVAAEKRTARRVRAPLHLRHAARHLTSPAGAAPRNALDAPVAAAPGPDAPSPLTPVLASLSGSPLATAHPDLVRACCDDLASLGTGEAAATAAIARLGELFDTCWNTLDEPGRAVYHQQAAKALGDLLEDADEAERARLLESYGRAAMRRSAPGCTATDVLALLDP